MTILINSENFMHLISKQKQFMEVKSMTKIEILLSDDQLSVIAGQLSDLITTEIDKIKKQENLNHRYMNKKQTCNYLQISNNTLDGWIKDGLPIIKIHGSNRFDRIAVDQWLSNLAK
ncbi:hypothetical protein JZO67_001136 [Enterococcus sp. 665A]|uniref:Helix-turn-helix domain-containing protein n=2 Tax=Candidatus Enterococcus ferrettii TaxID=2815324 RepID=A0ABV0EKM0_9ENTE|nr:helix-turn-helix domain-containing protein [Enterococcus sp. 665A]